MLPVIELTYLKKQISFSNVHVQVSASQKEGN